MENKEIKNISDFFSRDSTEITPEDKWSAIFQDWINKIDQKQKLLNLFETKLWFESIEDFFSSSYLEKIIFKFQDSNLRNYDFYLTTYAKILSKIITQLKELDFKKDHYILNFEEFIVEKILEKYSSRSLDFLRKTNTPESWFNHLKIYLQNIRNLSSELTKNEITSSKAFNSIIKIYHMELIRNPILISLLSGRFLLKIDKIYQTNISNIIASIKEKESKKHIGIFFILAFRIVKINNFIELNLNKSRNLNVTIPLIITLKKYIEKLFTFYESALFPVLEKYLNRKDKLEKIARVFEDFQLEYKKIYEGELIQFFDLNNERTNKRKVIKNIVIISDYAIQYLIENMAKLFNPQISGNNIFEHYTSRVQKSMEVKEKLVKLHTKINDFFSKKEGMSPSEIFFDINLFIETNLNYLLYKDWNEFLNHFNNLNNSNFTTEFQVNLRAFHSFITDLLKNIVDKN